MPSFVCDYCQETLKKAKLDQHSQRCRQAAFSCIDCYKSFKGTEYREHFTCITEVQKYHQKTPASTAAPNKTNINNNNSTKKPVDSKVEPLPVTKSVASATSESEKKVVKSTKTTKSEDKTALKSIKELIKTSKSPLSFKGIKKHLKKTHGRAACKKFFSDALTFDLDPATNSLTIKFD